MSTNFIVNQIEQWPIDRLVPFERNARTHSPEQVAQIAASIAEFGFVNPVLIGPDRIIVAGHARVLAARKLGLIQVPVISLGHLTPAQRRALVIVDNKLALNAGWDEQLLHLELAALREQDFDLNLLGFEDEELAVLLADEAPCAGLTDEDAAPEPPETPATAAGDMWILGGHKLLCGDATISAGAERLMSGEAADMVFTDPPYNVDYEGYTGDRLRIQGDRMSTEQFQRFLEDTFLSYRSIIKSGTSLYVCHSSSWQREFQNALERAG
jgi:hypothetical protein